MSTTKTVQCPACDRDSSVTYRCEHCGRDLAGQSPTQGSESL